jgi:CO/xanthine dehydrogenase FAD-binding subunit
MVAAVIEEGARGEVASARVAVGSCNAAPLRLERLESALKGAPVNRLAERLKPEYLAALSPISDVRATAAYRGDAALELVRRALAEFARC